MKKLVIQISFLALLINQRSFAATKATLDAKQTDKWHIQVQGKGFSSGKDVVIALDTLEPHASVACFSDFHRIAAVRENGEFTVNFYFDPRSECGFAACSRVPEPEHWIVIAENFLPQDRNEIARSAPLTCPPKQFKKTK